MLLVKIVLVCAVDRAFDDGACVCGGVAVCGQREVQFCDVCGARLAHRRAGRLAQDARVEVSVRAETDEQETMRARVRSGVAEQRFVLFAREVARAQQVRADALERCVHV